jgi:hypothetical protein
MTAPNGDATMKTLVPALLVLVLFFGTAVEAQAAPPSGSATGSMNRWFVGGTVGLGFGDVDWVELSPFAGYRASELVSVGAGLIWRYRKDNRFDNDLSTNDYGFNLFSRFNVARPFFLHLEYEYLSYQFIRGDLSKDRTNYSSVLGGGGVAYPISRNASFFAVLLYNFSYDSSERYSPYGDPWVLRAGVGAHF